MLEYKAEIFFEYIVNKCNARLKSITKTRRDEDRYCSVISARDRRK